MERFNKIAIYALFIIIISCSIFLIYKINANKKDYDKELYAEIYEEFEELNELDFTSVTDREIIKKDISTYKKSATGNTYRVIASISIPKISVFYPVIAETTEEYLKIAPTKLWGPNPNEEGNLCIIGHNWENGTLFSNLEKLENNDIVRIKDNTGNAVEYKVYDIYKVYPNEVECLNQETYGEREVTLITCTAGAIKRLVVKAIEIYD